jgi:hypothetical protein
LDPAIRLVDGKVACVSCHRPKSEHEGGVIPATHTADPEGRCTSTDALTVGTDPDGLCVACHSGK